MDSLTGWDLNSNQTKPNQTGQLMARDKHVAWPIFYRSLEPKRFREYCEIREGQEHPPELIVGDSHRIVVISGDAMDPSIMKLLEDDEVLLPLSLPPCLLLLCARFLLDLLKNWFSRTKACTRGRMWMRSPPRWTGTSEAMLQLSRILLIRILVGFLLFVVVFR